jgi:hypothetical protein
MTDDAFPADLLHAVKNADTAKQVLALSEYFRPHKNKGVALTPLTQFPWHVPCKAKHEVKPLTGCLFAAFSKKTRKSGFFS